ncbi:MAG: DUF5134 domain-containing protein [Streptosporangiaceae bacterium]|jgi:hypothetical protein
MAGQSWLADTFAGIMIITAAYCVSRLVVARRQHRPTDFRVDGVHVLMGVAMAGMLVPRLRVFWAGGWEIVFGVATAWFAWLTIREWMASREPRTRSAVSHPRAHHLQHVLGCGAMLYMFLSVTSARAASGGSGMSGMAGSAARFPTLALILALGLFGYVVWTADRLPGLATVAAFAARPTPAPVPAGAASYPSTATQASAMAPREDGQARTDGQAPDDSRLRAGQAPATPMSPRLAACCEIAMGVTMGYMLILML